MMGYHRCLEGHLYMGDYQRSDIRDESFMEHVMYVTHDPMIFKGTVRENLNMLSQYCDEQLWDVLKQVRLDGFFHEQMGLDTPLLENGSNLSGGQKQRLNLARALLKDVDVYIFDEATSNIDVESENHILNVIETLTQTKTVIFITHRLQSVVHCDEIYVMQQGALVEQGTHQELMHQEGIYHHMYQSQQELEVYSMNNVQLIWKMLKLVKPLTLPMLGAVLLGVLGFLCAIGIPVIAVMAILQTTGMYAHFPLSWVLGILLCLAILRGVLHYGEQALNHYIAFKLLAIIRDHVYTALRRLAPAKLDGKDKGT